MTIKRPFLLFLAAVLLFFAACLNEKKPLPDNQLPAMIIDTDLGFDDAMAIIYLLQYPGLTIDGITICGTGMSYPGPATKNALGMLALAGKPTIPVSTGDSVAINSHNTALRPQPWLTENSNMMGIPLPENPNPASDKDAVTFLHDYLEHAEDPVRIVALGPLTNLGRLLQQYPTLSDKIESIYMMGGAVNVPGNLNSGGIEDNPYAEWNIFLDPEAASIVFESGVDIILIPLDATNRAPITREFYNRFSADHHTPGAGFVFDIMSILVNDYPTVYFWDPLAAVVATDPSIISTQTFSLRVITKEGDENGRTKIDTVNGKPITVGEVTDMRRFDELFLDVLNRRE